MPAGNGMGVYIGKIHKNLLSQVKLSVADYIENVGQHIESIVYLAYSMADEFVKVN
jgi:HD superfamily phosphodiesterase